MSMGVRQSGRFVSTIIAGALGASAVMWMVRASGYNIGPSPTVVQQSSAVLPSPRLPSGDAEKLPPMLVDEYQLFSHEFDVTNPTSRPVRVLHQQPECACSVAELGTDLLQPGETTKLRMSRHIGPPGGTFTLGASLITDCPEMPRWRYAVELPVYERCRFIPARLVFGTVEAGQTIGRSIQFESYGHATDTHHSFRGGSSDHVRLTVIGETVESPQGNGIVCRITPLRAELEPGHDVGDHTETLVLDIESETTVPQTLAAAWVVCTPIQVSPRGGVFFGRVSEEAGIETRTVLLRSSGVPFAIQGVKVPEGETIDVQYGNEATEIHAVRIRLKCAEVSGAVTGEVVLETDHPKQREVKIRFAALGN